MQSWLNKSAFVVSVTGQWLSTEKHWQMNWGNLKLSINGRIHISDGKLVLDRKIFCENSSECYFRNGQLSIYWLCFPLYAILFLSLTYNMRNSSDILVWMRIERRVSCPTRFLSHFPVCLDRNLDEKVVTTKKSTTGFTLDEFPA